MAFFVLNNNNFVLKKEPSVATYKKYVATQGCYTATKTV